MNLGEMHRMNLYSGASGLLRRGSRGRSEGTFLSPVTRHSDGPRGANHSATELMHFAPYDVRVAAEERVETPSR